MRVHTISRSPIAIAAALALTFGACPVLAQSAATAIGNASVAAPADAVERDMARMSDEGRQAMQAVHEARIALFEGDPQAASDALTLAKASLQVAKVDAPIDVVDVTARAGGKVVADDVVARKVDLVPIDGRFVIDERMVQNPARKAHVAKASQHMAQGRIKAAAQELKLAEVDASYSRVLMPLRSTTAQVEQAAKLLGEKKYYDANLALKAAEEGLRMDLVIVSGTPEAKAAVNSKNDRQPNK